MANPDIVTNSASPTKLPQDDGFSMQSFAATKDAENSKAS